MKTYGTDPKALPAAGRATGRVVGQVVWRVWRAAARTAAAGASARRTTVARLAAALSGIGRVAARATAARPDARRTTVARLAAALPGIGRVAARATAARPGARGKTLPGSAAATETSWAGAARLWPAARLRALFGGAALRARLGVLFGTLLGALLAVLPTACGGRADGKRTDETSAAGAGAADSCVMTDSPSVRVVSENPVGSAATYGIPLLDNLLLANPPAANPAAEPLSEQNPGVERFSSAAEPLSAEELSAKRAANLILADYLWRDGSVVRLALTAEEAAALGVPARYWAEALQEIAHTNRIIREHLSLGDTIPIYVPERPRKTFGGK